MAVYYATKAYVLSLSEALHEEAKPPRRHRDGALPRPGADRVLRARASLQMTRLVKMRAMTLSRRGGRPRRARRL